MASRHMVKVCMQTGYQLRTNNLLHLARYLSTSYVRSARRVTPMNHIIHFVPHQEEWIVERFGKYCKTLSPGLNLLFPVIDQIKYIQSLKEQAIEIPSQSAITEDNVTLHIDGVLYLKVFNSYKASYGVEDAEYAMIQLAQTTMRSELGKIALDRVFQERTSLNASIVEAINHASEAWGIYCMRYEIRDIQLPVKVKEAMQMQVEAERKKRAVVLESEGAREAAINRAEGLRQSKILTSEAEKIQQINIAQGDAGATLTKAYARAKSLNVVGEAIGRQHGTNAASLSVAEQYVDAFKNLAKSSNTVLLPEKTGDVSSMVAQAMGIYSSMVKPSSDVKTHDSEEESENTDFHHQMEEIVQQVENQSFISKQPADVKIAPVEKSDVSSLFPSSKSSAGGPHKEGSPHMTLADSLTRRKTDDP